MKIELQRGAIPITLDRPRILFFDMAATWLLLQKYGVDFLRELYTVNGTGDGAQLKLKSIDALQYFLWLGLQAELADTGEVFTLDQAKDQVKPWTVREIFYALVKALTGAIANPEQPGKEAGADPAAKTTPARNAASGGAKASTTTKRRGLSAVS